MGALRTGSRKATSTREDLEHEIEHMRDDEFEVLELESEVARLKGNIVQLQKDMLAERLTWGRAEEIRLGGGA